MQTSHDYKPTGVPHDEEAGATTGLTRSAEGFRDRHRNRRGGRPPNFRWLFIYGFVMAVLSIAALCSVVIPRAVSCGNLFFNGGCEGSKLWVPIIFTIVWIVFTAAAIRIIVRAYQVRAAIKAGTT